MKNKSDWPEIAVGELILTAAKVQRASVYRAIDKFIVVKRYIRLTKGLILKFHGLFLVLVVGGRPEVSTQRAGRLSIVAEGRR